MMNRGAAEKALVKALILAMSLGAMAHAGLGYLPLAGPPPLRMQAAKNPLADVVHVNWAADTNFTATLAATEAIQMPTNNSMTASGETNSTDDVVMPISLGAGNLADDPFGTSVLSMASPDLLNITPQMLAAYFHPVARGTNTVAGVIAPAPIIFMPPSARSEQSSHAEYIVK